ncbi:MAG: antibiotic biosynthesis monooxygenase [Rhodococcus sp. (in: high G+C Gram-positive bacteria)]|uniref:putative quinol monooxygenase n=1 Tax=Rhodococcus sp. TaxID=1831 RepID=UPI002ADCDE1B|nr:antibiotic biosynthesis monooxygenase [Rhodococcus sp. (in: high G+C Gram-positive bacteria)]
MHRTRSRFLVTHRTQPGQRDAVRAVWEQHMAPAPVAANPGHLSYAYCFDDTDPDVISAFQVYRDPQAANDFQHTSTYRAYETAVTPLLAGAPSVVRLTPAWTKVGAASQP